MSPHTELHSVTDDFNFILNFPGIYVVFVVETYLIIKPVCVQLINISVVPFSTVSAEILKGSLTTMERHIQRLETDIENFPKTDDPQDKFVEKMSISFFIVGHFHTMHTFSFPRQQHMHWSILGQSLS